MRSRCAGGRHEKRGARGPGNISKFNAAKRGSQGREKRCSSPDGRKGKRGLYPEVAGGKPAWEEDGPVLPGKIH